MHFQTFGKRAYLDRANSAIFNDDQHHFLIIIILECANGGSLRSYLVLNFSSMTGDEKIRLAKEITKGIIYLHQKGILHGDLVIIRLHIYYTILPDNKSI